MGSTANILVCRLCQGQGLAENFEELFVLVSDGRVEAHPVAQKIERFLELEVKLDDPLPKRICKSCEIRIDQWSEFFATCHALYDELQIKIAYAQRVDPELLLGRTDPRWQEERVKPDNWNEPSQAEQWDSVMDELTQKKEGCQYTPREHLDHSSSPNSDCYTGISGLLKAAEVTGLEEARMIEKNNEYHMMGKTVSDNQVHENGYADLYTYNQVHHDDLVGDDMKDQYSPSGPINLTGSSYNDARSQQSEWRDTIPNALDVSPQTENSATAAQLKDEMLVSLANKNLTADELVNLLGSKHPALKGQLAQALIGQHLALGAGPSSNSIPVDEARFAESGAPPFTPLRQSSDRTNASANEECSADEWGSSIHSGTCIEQDARHVPVLTSTGNPRDSAVSQPPVTQVKIPVTVEQMQNPRILTQKDISELSALFEKGDKKGIWIFITRATRQTVRLWRCTRCSATIEGLMKHLEDHYRMIHDVDPEYECDLCDMVLASSHDYSRHWASHIPIKRCDICNKVDGNLYAVSGGEENQRRVVCEVCSRRYMVATATGSSYATGFSTTMNRSGRRGSAIPGEDGKFPCEICGKRLKSKQTLSTHMTLHRDDKTVPCPECSMAFPTKADLRNHRSTEHEKDKRFVCPVPECQKRFKTRVALKGHETLHTGEKPYKCPICPKEIRAQSNFYTHLKVHRKRGEEIPSMSSSPVVTKSSPANSNYVVSINDFILPKEDGDQPTEPSPESYSSDFQESPIASDLSLRCQGQIDSSPWGYELDQ